MDDRSRSGTAAAKIGLFPPPSSTRSSTRSTPLDPRVRGAIVREELRAARSLAGDAAVDDALSLLSPEARHELGDVLAVSWCRLATLRTFHETTAATIKEDPTAWHLRLVEHATQEMFSTTWRFFLRLTSPDALVRRASSVYSRIFDTGKLEAFVVEPGHSVARLTGWPEPPAFHLDAVATGIVTVLRVAKIGPVRAKWTRTPTGADFEIRAASRSKAP